MGSKTKYKNNHCPPTFMEDNPFNQQVLQPLKLLFEKKHENDRDVILMILEDDYETVKDSEEVEKTANLPEYPKSPVPNHFITFGIKNIKDTWYQPILTVFWKRGFQISNEKKSGMITKVDLVHCFIDVIKAIQGINLNIICTVSPPTKRLCKIIDFIVDAKEYKVEHRFSNELVYKVNHKLIIHLYDPVELLRELRDTFAFKDVYYEEHGQMRRASIDHLKVWLSTIERKNRIIDVETHLKPDKRHKFITNNVFELYSADVAAALELEMKLGNLNKNEFIGTSNYIRLFNNLFNSLNSNPRNDTENYTMPMMIGSTHFDLWRKSFPILESMHFSGPWHDTSCLDASNTNLFRKWISNVKGSVKIFDVLHKKGWNSYCTRSFSCESLFYFIKKVAMQNGLERPDYSNEKPRHFALNKGLEDLSLEFGTFILAKPNTWCYNTNIDD